MVTKTIAIIAGTPVDTEIGVNFFKLKGLNPKGYTLSKNSEEQSKLQILSPAELTEEVRKTIRRIKNEEINLIIIYCNSLSSAVNMDKLSMEEEIRIITPLHVYKGLAKNHRSLGVIAANNQSAAGIEKTIQGVNPSCDVIGIGILPLVNEIEKGTIPSIIIDKFDLKTICEVFKSLKVEAVILGCTHFPYIHRELEKNSNIPLIEPSEMIYKMI